MSNPPTPLGRLLTVISWEGSAVRQYRRGGRGMENVLTADVFSALDSLPRVPFLANVLSAATWADRGRRDGLLAEIGSAEFTIFPQARALRPTAKTHQARVEVQPDGIIMTSNHAIVVEAKRIKTSSFQPEQLARNVLVALRDSEHRTPTLLLVLGKEPPVLIRRNGRKPIEEAVELNLEQVYAKTEGINITLRQVRSLVPSLIAWITWRQIVHSIEHTADSFQCPDRWVAESVHRIARTLVCAVEWHADA